MTTDQEPVESLPASKVTDVQPEFLRQDLKPGRLTLVGLLLEAGCVLVALFLAYFGLYDHAQPLNKLFDMRLAAMIGWSAGGFAAISLCAIAFLVIRWKPFREFRNFVLRELVPLFAPLSMTQVALISASAGIGEEMLFRWSLQGGLQHLVPGTYGLIAALIIASVAFGMVHAVTPMYALIATVIGSVLGLILIFSGSVIPAILAHAFYDFVAILILRRNRNPGNHSASTFDRTVE